MKIKFCKLMAKVFLAYLKAVATTGNLEVVNEEWIRKNALVGYWHGDSYCMQLILQRIAKTQDKISVIVTADKRGDVIEEMIRPFKAKALRLPDGLRMRPFLQGLITYAKQEDGILAASLDGPTGPLHEPKKLLFLLASEAQKPVVYIHFQYKRVIRLKNRWDRYVIPLPFCRIRAEVKELGYITKEDLKNFNEMKKTIQF